MGELFYFIDTELLTITTFLSGEWYGTDDYISIKELQEEIENIKSNNLKYEIKRGI